MVYALLSWVTTIFVLCIVDVTTRLTGFRPFCAIADTPLSRTDFAMVTRLQREINRDAKSQARHDTPFPPYFRTTL